MKCLNLNEVKEVAGGDCELMLANMTIACVSAIAGGWLGMEFQKMMDRHLVDESQRLVGFYENQVRQLNGDVHTILARVNPSPASIIKV